MNLVVNKANFFIKAVLAKILAVNSLSGLIYLLAYFLFAPARDFFYLYSSTISGSFSSILIFLCIINYFLLDRKMNYN